jgi:hypothetical protein
MAIALYVFKLALGLVGTALLGFMLAAAPAALSQTDSPSPNVQKESGQPSKEPEAGKRSESGGKPIGGQPSTGAGRKGQ